MYGSNNLNIKGVIDIIGHNVAAAKNKILKEAIKHHVDYCFILEDDIAPLNNDVFTIKSNNSIIQD